jgi:hypothetical protein
MGVCSGSVARCPSGSISLQRVSRLQNLSAASSEGPAIAGLVVLGFVPLKGRTFRGNASWQMGNSSVPHLFLDALITRNTFRALANDAS